MNLNFLLPHKYKIIGLWIFIPTAVFGFIYSFSLGSFQTQWLEVSVFSLTQVTEIFGDDQGPGMITNNILDELLAVLIIISGLMVLLAREKHEDEMIIKIRLESLLWATLWSYGILLFAIIFIYGEMFFSAMLINMFTLLVLFIVRFNWKLYKLRKMESSNEE